MYNISPRQHYYTNSRPSPHRPDNTAYNRTIQYNEAINIYQSNLPTSYHFKTDPPDVPYTTSTIGNFTIQNDINRKQCINKIFPINTEMNSFLSPGSTGKKTPFDTRPLLITFLKVYDKRYLSIGTCRKNAKSTCITY